MADAAEVKQEAAAAADGGGGGGGEDDDDVDPLDAFMAAEVRR
jgi:hypothetical protein